MSWLSLNIGKLGGAAAGVRALISYTMQTISRLADGTRYLNNFGSSGDTNDADCYACQGLWFDGTSQNIDFTYSTATHVVYFLHGLNSFWQDTLAGSPWNFNPPAGIVSSMAFLTSSLSAGELTYLNENQEVLAKIALGGTDSGIPGLTQSDFEHFYPLNDYNSGTATVVHDILDQAWTTTETIVNPQAGRWTNGDQQQKGPQDIAFERDSTGRITSMADANKAEFDGNEYLDTQYTLQAVTPFTIECVFYKGNITAAHALHGTANTYFGQLSNGDLRIYAGNGLTVTKTVANAFYHGLICFDGTTTTIYVTGALEATGTPTGYQRVFKLGCRDNVTLEFFSPYPITLFKVHPTGFDGTEALAAYNKAVAGGFLS